MGCETLKKVGLNTKVENSQSRTPKGLLYGSIFRIKATKGERKSTKVRQNIYLSSTPKIVDI